MVPDLLPLLPRERSDDMFMGVGGGVLQRPDSIGCLYGCEPMMALLNDLRALKPSILLDLWGATRVC